MILIFGNKNLLVNQIYVRKNDNYGVEQYIKRLDYDGLMIGTGKDTDLISFKNIAKNHKK